MCTLGLVLFGLLLVRLLLMGAKPPEFASSDNPSSRCPSGLTRTLTFLYLPSFNFLLLVFPKWLSFDWSMDAIPRISSVFDARNFATLLFYHAIYKIVSSYVRKLSAPQSPRGSDDPPKCQVCKTALTQHCRVNNNNNNNNYYLKYNQKEPLLTYKNVYSKCANKCDCARCVRMESLKYKYKSWVVSNRASQNVNRKSLCSSSASVKTNAHVVLLSFAFLIIPFIPATNLFFYVGFVVAERVLYIPSLGYCLLVSFGCNLIYKRTNRRAVIVCATLVLVLVYAIRTLVRNNDWIDEESLYRSGIPINPPKGKSEIRFPFANLLAAVTLAFIRMNLMRKTAVHVSG
ncbi:UNVERIFIED_CONTAM: hypothetical protein PYX00_009046 [Menopon gallinae]|uniref:DUF1736 domain-containing protein n=1 Tax=Menopon gallinae TaxID=328185 RepID=A0AAW2H9S1_9NEOP